MELVVYLAGQIHDPWRGEVRAEAERLGLGVRFVGPQEDHGVSDGIGEEILGEQPDGRWKDEVASQVNNLRTRVLMNKSDVVIACFGETYRQWNTAMDASAAIGADKPLIVIRDPGLHHALKELSQRAQLTVDTPAQAAQALAYILR